MDALGHHTDRNITSDSQMILDWHIPNAKGQQQLEGAGGEPEDIKNHPPSFSLDHLLLAEYIFLRVLKNSESTSLSLL